MDKNNIDTFTDKLIVGDCTKVMKTMPHESIDLIITSPPYDDLRTYNGYSFDFEAMSIQLLRILKQGSILVWVVGDKINGEGHLQVLNKLYSFKRLVFLYTM